MALINCKECGKEISSEAKSCPNCGYKRKEKHSNLIIIAIVTLLVVIISFITFMFCNKNLKSLTTEEKYAIKCILDYKSMLKNSNHYKFIILNGRRTNL